MAQLANPPPVQHAQTKTADPPAIVSDVSVLSDAVPPEVPHHILKELAAPFPDESSPMHAAGKPLPQLSMAEAYHVDPLGTFKNLENRAYGDNVYPLSQLLRRDFEAQFGKHPLTHLKIQLESLALPPDEKERILATHSAGLQPRMLSAEDMQKMYANQQRVMGSSINPKACREIVALAVDEDAKVLSVVGYGRAPSRPLSDVQKRLVTERAAEMDSLRWAAHIMRWREDGCSSPFGRIHATISSGKLVRTVPSADGGKLMLYQFPLKH